MINLRSVLFCSLDYFIFLFTFPFEVLGYSSLEQKLYKLSVGHDEFWDQIDVPVSVLPQIFWWLLFFSEIFPEVREVK